MEKLFIEGRFFFGKIGADNLLLIIIGIEHFILFGLKFAEERRFRRIWLYLWEGVFFIGYGFFNDIYRFKALRPYILQYATNFVHVNAFAIMLFGLPLLVKITIDIHNLIIERRKTRYVRFDKRN